MPTTPAARWKRTLALAFRLTRSPEPSDSSSLDALRSACRGLVADLPSVQRHELLLCISNARNAQDVWHLRSHLFGVISLTFGEHVARDRLRQLDSFWQ
jgi:hypothetical protein